MTTYKIFEDSQLRTLPLGEITSKNVNTEKSSLRMDHAFKHYHSNNVKVDNNSLPPKRSNTLNIESALTSVRGKGKENDNAPVFYKSKSQRITDEDEYAFSQEKMTQNQKSSTSGAKRYGYNFPDSTYSPMNANNTQHVINLEDSFERRSTKARPMTTLPSSHKQNYYDESPGFEGYSQGHSRQYLPSEKAIFDIEEIDDNDDFNIANAYNKSSGMPPLHSKTKNMSYSRPPQKKNTMPERIQSSGNYTNRLNMSNLSRGNEPETPTNQTFDLQRYKNKVELYDELLKRHMGRSARDGINPFKGTTQTRDKITRVSSALQRETLDKLLPNKSSTKKVVSPSGAPSNVHNLNDLRNKKQIGIVNNVMTDRRSPSNVTTKLTKIDSFKKIAVDGSHLNPVLDAKSPKNSITNYKLDKMLGQGSYAIVKLGENKVTGEKVAVKTYEKYRLADPRKMKNVRREISILQNMDHPHVIKLHETCENTKQIHLVMEYVGKQSLHGYLKAKTNRKIEEPEAKKIYSQLIKGMAYCHSKHIAHRDIKLENILIDDNKNVKIIDFGFSLVTTPGQTLNIFCGTPSYMAPEIVSKKNYKGHATDCWALGILLFTLLCGHFPFRGYDDRDLFAKIKKGKFDIPSHVSDSAKALLNRILKVNCDERPTMEEILSDRWFLI